MELRFDAASHTYTLGGRAVPGVSTIIEPAYDFRFVNAEAMEKARDKGHKVHKTIQLHEQAELKRDTLHETLAKYLAQWERFKEDFGYVPLGIEVPVHSVKYQFAGTMDSHGVLIPQDADGDQHELLLDVKTGEEYEPHKLQTAGYGIAAVERGILKKGHKRASLYLSEDGYALRWHTGLHDDVAFLALLTFHRWRQSHGR